MLKILAACLSSRGGQCTCVPCLLVNPTLVSVVISCHQLSNAISTHFSARVSVFSERWFCTVYFTM